MTTIRSDNLLRSGIRYVITLSSTAEQTPDLAPLHRELEGFSIFRSVVMVRGQKRVRLHIGYFASEAAAREALEAVIRSYPDARVEFAPRSGLGSLDDTMNTGFSVVKAAAARLRTTVPPAAPAVPRPAAAPEAPARTAAPATAAPAARVTPPAPPPRTPLETTAARVTAPERPVTPGLQIYVVQLDQLSSTAEAAQRPSLEIFDAYHLYKIRVMREGVAYQTLRLGFFQRMESAEAVANHIRPAYPGARVLPASAREQDMVLDLVKTRQQLALRSVSPVPAAERGAVSPSAPIPAQTSLPTSAAETAAPEDSMAAFLAGEGDMHYEFNPAEI